MIPSISVKDGDSVRVLIDAQVASYRAGDPGLLAEACREAFVRGLRMDTPGAQRLVQAAAPLCARATRFSASASELAELRFLSRGARWFSPATARAVIAALDGFPSPARIAEREALRAACVERLRREPNAGADIKGVGGPGAARRDG